MIVRSRTKTSADPPFTAKRIAVEVACVTDKGAPVPGAKVTLYEREGWALEYRPTATKFANAAGLCRFEDVALSDPDVAFLTSGITVWICNIAAQADGRVAVMGSVLSQKLIGSTATITLVMHRAQRLTGRVATPTGDPLSGALVYQGGQYDQKSTGIRCTRTDKDGRYELSDLEAWSAPNDGLVRVTDKKGRVTAFRQLPIWVYHPDYGAKYVRCRAIPGTMDVRMDPAGTLAGRVVDATTGQPIAGVSVWAVSAPSERGRITYGSIGSLTDPKRKYKTPVVARNVFSIRVNKEGLFLTGPTYGTNWAVTDQHGNYKMPVVAGNVYRVQVNKQGFFETTSRPFSSEVVADATSEIPEIAIAKVGTIRGRLVDAASGKPLSFPSKPRISVSLGTPLRDFFGKQPWLADVNVDGTFVRRAVPSERSYSLSVISSDPAVKIKRDFGELTVGPGETVEVELPVEPLDR